ncbi:hypothetical protein [Candidatus Nitrospira neomarina]|uniref:Uncharacterized protein n=1 Tax=Candidatus Nitrospira neomarina TaxID=3020899 RepID=A0AA96K1Z4_9BACT|nr:hypothetical protein [Candidatus Nitrospira neomarina]WNM61169.1 hypothetical protein PQG83_15600 [Candidatus Nitrospira neomarina]
MIDGFYSIFFTGVSGQGFGVIVLKDGILVGADNTGGSYDGHYTVNNEKQFLIGEVVLNAPPGIQLVTGAATGSEPASWVMPLSLPPDFGNGRAFPMKTPTGPINIIFRKLRDI